jgi:hypothetical protein
MPKRKKTKPKRAPKPRPRDLQKDDRGIPLTSDQRPVAFLPSDFMEAMRQPPGTPMKATAKMVPRKPTTVIPELRLLELSPFAYQTVGDAIDAADRVHIEKLNPTGGANLHYRIELAAAFLAFVMDHAYEAGVATGTDSVNLVHLATNLVIRRAQEIYASGGA